MKILLVILLIAVIGGIAYFGIVFGKPYVDELSKDRKQVKKELENIRSEIAEVRKTQTIIESKLKSAASSEELWAVSDVISKNVDVLVNKCQGMCTTIERLKNREDPITAQRSTRPTTPPAIQFSTSNANDPVLRTKNTETFCKPSYKESVLTACDASDAQYKIITEANGVLSFMFIGNPTYACANVDALLAKYCEITKRQCPAPFVETRSKGTVEKISETEWKVVKPSAIVISL